MNIGVLMDKCPGICALKHRCLRDGLRRRGALVLLPYSCRGGVCGACVGRVVEGRADMSDIDDVGFCLDEAQQADGMALLCMARPAAGSPQM